MNPISCPCGRQFKSVRALSGHARACNKATDDARMWAGINKDAPGGCWEWLGALQRDGYAHFNRDGKTLSLHRYVYERLVGPIPDGLDLLHQCDNRRCCNPGHMKQGSHQDNMADAYKKKRHAWGERCHFSKVTAAQAAEIRRLYKKYGPKRSNADVLSEQFGISKQIINCIGSGRTWKNL